MVKNIVGKAENADYMHFCSFPNIILKVFSLRVIKSQDYKVINYKMFSKVQL